MEVGRSNHVKGPPSALRFRLVDRSGWTDASVITITCSSKKRLRQSPGGDSKHHTKMILAGLLQGVPEALPKNPITRWEGVFPVIESLHICGFTLLVGTATILDLRLLGISLVRHRVSEIAKQLSPWIGAGIAAQLITGPYLFFRRSWGIHSGSRVSEQDAFLGRRATFSFHRHSKSDEA
jgi:hypothetical protein